MPLSFLFAFLVADFSPHGLHVSQRNDGQWQLLVVNHWGRESIEFFSSTRVTN